MLKKNRQWLATPHVLEVLDKILNGLDSDGKTAEGVGDAGGKALLNGDARVSHDGASGSKMRGKPK